ncbi:MAG: hypothetical protein U1F33_15395 [Alphaproteobacteria bacterium]
MSGRVLIIGLGDLGRRYAASLAARGRIDALILAGGGKGQGPAIAAMIESCHAVPTRYEALDATRQGDVEALLRRAQPDLVLQCASLFSPWEILAGDDPHIRAIRSAGVAIQLPAQLPILHAVMSAARAVDMSAPVINLSWPDGTNPIMARMGLAPTLGLGNLTMIVQRVHAALARDATEHGRNPRAVPLVRALGDASTLWPVLSSTPPEDPERGCRIYLGEEGTRADAWAYRGPPLESGAHLNELTCASSVAVVEALLPGGPSVRASCPGVGGLAGGYPIRIEAGRVAFDLPPAVSLDDAIAFNASLAEEDGIARIERDGTVVYTEHARSVMASIDPVLAEPLRPSRAAERFPHLIAALTARRPATPQRRRGSP